MYLRELVEITDQLKAELKMKQNNFEREKQENENKANSQFEGVKKNLHKKSKNKPKSMKIAPTANLVHPTHSSFNLVFNIMLGIKKAIDSVSENPLMEFEHDYKIKCIYQIAPWRI